MPYDPFYSGENNPWQNLQNFGFATMAAGAQPGATTMGAIGQGGMAASETARQNAMQTAQAKLIKSQAQHSDLENQLIPYQMRLLGAQSAMYNAAAGDDTDSPPPTPGAGQSFSPTLGNSPPTSIRQQPVASNIPIDNAPIDKFQNASGIVMNNEGGYVANDSGAGPTMFGINSEANPDLFADGKMPTRTQAIQRIKDNYWSPIGGDQMSPAFATVALDGAVNQGVETMKPLIAQANGDPQKLIQLRAQLYQDIAQNNPAKAENLPGWMNRLQNLSQQVGIQSAVQIPKPTRQQRARAFLGDKLAPEEYKATVAGPVAASEAAAKLPYEKKRKEEETTGENIAEAKKTYASISGRIDNAKKIIEKMKSLSADMPNRGPFNTEVALSKHIGTQKLESSVKSFENLNENLFTQELPGVVPPGSKLDIPIVNALQKASKVDPHESHTARMTILNNLQDLLDKAQENAAKNYGILSDTPVPVKKNTASAPSIVTHTWNGSSIVPVGGQ